MACKKYANKVGMTYESKGQHIGKTPSLCYLKYLVIYVL